MLYFIGAGPGDPELITLKGKRLIEAADIIIYAGSLVNSEILKFAKAGCSIYDSSGMTLEEVLSTITRGTEEGREIVRLHTGDPSIYGTIREQMDALEKKDIPFEVVPGVSSFFAAASSLKKEYTLPGISQTVILTRMGGRTAVPEGEDIESLSRHGCTMVVFLSTGMIESLVERLKAGYKETTPAAVVYKASWPDQKIIRGTLSDIAEKVKAENITKTALVLVGNFLGDDYQLSKLYDKGFSHEYRSAGE